MKRILIFSGTTEGRRITEFLDGRNVKVYVSAATEYGKECTGEHENAEVFFGRMDQKQMAEMIKEKQIDLVIDATHPFAQLVTGEIRRACEISGVKYLRCLREEMEAVPDEADRVIWAQSVEDAVEYLQNTEGKILITTGSKELEAFAGDPVLRERIFARVLPDSQVLKKCEDLGLHNAGTIFKGDERGYDPSDRCEIFCDQRIGKSRRLWRKGTGSKGNRGSSCCGRKTKRNRQNIFRSL